MSDKPPVTWKGTIPLHNVPVPEGYDTAMLYDPFELFVGPFFDQRKRGAYKFAFRVDERHVNMGGICHGGMLLTFADSALGFTAGSVIDGMNYVTVSMQASFLRPAQLGQLVEVAPHVTRKTRELVFVRGDFRVGDALVMTAASLWKILGGA